MQDDIPLGLNFTFGRHSYVPPVNLVILLVPYNQRQLKERVEREGFVLLNENANGSTLRTFQQGRHQRLSCFHLAKPLDNVDEASAKHDIMIAKTLTTQQEELLQRRSNVQRAFPAFVQTGNSPSRSTKRGLNT